MCRTLTGIFGKKPKKSASVEIPIEVAADHGNSPFSHFSSKNFPTSYLQNRKIHLGLLETMSTQPPPPQGGQMTQRARRRREEAVRRLVAEVQAQESSGATNANAGDPLAENGGDLAPSAAALMNPETHDWLVASVTATALEKGMDRDLHSALVQEAKYNAGRIGQICQDHADVFLDSVASVASLEKPANALSDGLQQAQESLNQDTAGPMLQAALSHSQAIASLQRAQTLFAMVEACRETAIELEKGRKQAANGRPRAALQAVDKARSQLSRPIQSLTQHSQSRKPDEEVLDLTEVFALNPADAKKSLLETPFGKRASVSLPKIENEVLMGARRNLNRWFLALRSGGEGAKAGRSVLRQCAFNLAVGPGHLSLGGQFPTAYMWRAKTADNLLTRVHLHGKVARALRQGYWFERDAAKEAENVGDLYAPNEGLQRKAEAIATAFGWYRCWETNDLIQLDPAEFAGDEDNNANRSRNGEAGLSGSRHGQSGGLSGSRHGMGGSKHGGSQRGKRSLSFRASTSSKSQAFQDISSTLGNSVRKSSSGAALASQWNETMYPTILYERTPNRKTEDDILLSLPESVHPVRRAEIAFSLLGRSDEFYHYYEQNRFGEMKVGGDDKSKGSAERKSYLSSLTGDDVTMGNERIFFSKTLPHLTASVAGFSAVEAALELGNFEETDDDQRGLSNGLSIASSTNKNASRKASSTNMSKFRESSERYERALETELGSLIRSRAKKASMVHLVKASQLLAALRASLKLVHPSSGARRYDKDYLSFGKDGFVMFTKLAQEEQLKVTAAIVVNEQKIPMLVTDMFSAKKGFLSVEPSSFKNIGVPDPEEVGLPFGLSNMKQKPSNGGLEAKDTRTTFNRSSLEVDDAYSFSNSVPAVIRSLHARAIACGAFALNQQELGVNFPEKSKGSNAAGFVLDCVEQCVNVAAVGMKDSDNTVDEGSVEKAVQVMANITALQHCLPRFFATLIRGMCIIGLIKGDELDETLEYTEKIVKAADKACDAQIGSTYSLVYEICRNKIDHHINFALENFNWVAKTVREKPNLYCEGLIGYLKSVFNSLGPMDEGSRAGLHFSCCGHVSERMVKLLAGKPGDTTTMDDSAIQPITRIDAFGIKNLHTDLEELEKFADTTGVPQLRDCFSELRALTTFLLDKELPTLVLPDSAAARRRKYPLLSLEKVGNVLEKYVGTGLGEKLMGGAAGRNVDILFIDKKEVPPLVKIIRSQQMS